MEKKTDSVNSNEIAKQVGIDRFTCPKCGGRMNGMEALKLFFQTVVETCRGGVKVRVMGFGVFEAKKHKGRIIKSPVLEGGKSKSKDQLVLSFRQSPGSKRLLNPEREKKTGGKRNG